jgi:hypothetical protein
MSAISMGATQGIGDYFKLVKNKNLLELRLALAHATFNGTMRFAQGGKFEHGFMSGFVSSLGGSFMQANAPNMSTGAQVAMSAVIGGTAEKLGGGKFANGAVTGAYVMMFNHLGDHGDEKQFDPTWQPPTELGLSKKYGGDWSLAMDIASGSATGLGLATSLRYKLEWEYLRQARINRAISGDFSKPIKHSLRTIRGFGTGFTVAGGFIGVVNFGLSDRSWGDYGQLGVSLLSTGLTFGSVTAPIGIGIGLIDTFGGFNGFYNYLDNQQNFYNNTGGIMVPINGIPSFIPLK